MNFIKKSITHPGSLRAEAARMKLIKGDETLSQSDLDVLEAHAKAHGDEHLMRQVELARTLMKMHRK